MASGSLKSRPTAARRGPTRNWGRTSAATRIRPWSFELDAKRGKNTVMANAINNIGQTQTAALIWQSGRLPQQRDAKHHAERELREEIMRRFVFAFVAVLIALPALAQEQEIKLKPGPGLDKVEGNCAACHSLAYIPMNSPFLNADGMECRGHQDDQGDGRADQRRRRQGHRRLSDQELRDVDFGINAVARVRAA